MEVFRSHGRDGNAPLVERICEALRAAGHRA
jgi:hypothetical protein